MLLINIYALLLLEEFYVVMYIHIAVKSDMERNNKQH